MVERRDGRLRIKRKQESTYPDGGGNVDWFTDGSDYTPASRPRKRARHQYTVGTPIAGPSRLRVPSPPVAVTPARVSNIALLVNTPEGYYLVADTAFPRGSKHIDGRIRAPLKAGEKLEGTQEQIQDQLAFNRQLLSYRQSAEWGMRAIQGSFGRLRIPLDISRAEDRAHLLETCIRLHNFRTRVVGINQIRTVYFKHWWDDDEEAQLCNSLEHMFFSDPRKNDRVARYHVDVVYD